MILDHCHRASCTQIIESLRAENARLILLESQHEFNHSRYLNLCRDLAAMTKKRDNYKDMISEQWAQPELKAALAENSRMVSEIEATFDTIAAKDAVIERLKIGMAKHSSAYLGHQEEWEELLNIPNDDSALQARLAQERAKVMKEIQDAKD